MGRSSASAVRWVCLLVLASAACDSVAPTEPDEPVVQEASFTTPAASVHAMVLVPAGAFVRGSEFGGDDEQPVGAVHEDAFYIDKFEVTNALFTAYVEATGARNGIHAIDPRFSGADQPIVGITWEEANSYCDWAGLRLPTEAEWEKAARGEDGRAFPWGNTPPTPQHAAFNGATTEASPVGSHPLGASPYGALDMAGNVWEWTRDTYIPDWYAISPDRNPVCTLGGDQSDHSLRGGGWMASADQLRVAERARMFGLTGDIVTARVGFRCARDAE